MASHKVYSAPIHIANNVYIQPTYFVVKPQFNTDSKRRSIKQLKNETNLKNNKRNSSLSTKSIKNLRNSINWLLAAAKMKKVYSKADNKHFWFKVNFITMTIPIQETGLVTEKKFKECLNIWLTYARKYFYLDNYIWKIETHKDNRLHIHITTDTFINHRKLRESWNRILQSKQLLTLHYNKYNNYNPNSTDVHSVHKVHNLAAYMCEYMTKKPELPETYKGRIWSCSYSLSSKHKCTAELEPTWNKDDYGFMNRKEIKYKKIETIPDALGGTKWIADLYLLNEDGWNLHMKGKIKEAYNNKRRRIRYRTRTSPDEYRQIDFFGSRNVEEKYAPKELINIFEKCEIRNCIPKIGSTQLGLQY